MIYDSLQDDFIFHSFDSQGKDVLKDLIQHALEVKKAKGKKVVQSIGMTHVFQTGSSSDGSGVFSGLSSFVKKTLPWGNKTATAKITRNIPGTGVYGTSIVREDPPSCGTSIIREDKPTKEEGEYKVMLQDQQSKTPNPPQPEPPAKGTFGPTITDKLKFLFRLVPKQIQVRFTLK